MVLVARSQVSKKRDDSLEKKEGKTKQRTNKEWWNGMLKLAKTKRNQFWWKHTKKVEWMSACRNMAQKHNERIRHFLVSQHRGKKRPKKPADQKKCRVSFAGELPGVLSLTGAALSSQLAGNWYSMHWEKGGGGAFSYVLYTVTIVAACTH